MRENLHGNNIQKEGTDFPEILACVPWGHHIEIIAKCKNINESIFYILKTISGGWSRNTLTNCIKADYYHTSGGAISNFADRLPSPQSELAQAITKDTYDFGFLTLEEGYKEEALETELENMQQQGRNRCPVRLPRHSDSHGRSLLHQCPD